MPDVVTDKLRRMAGRSDPRYTEIVNKWAAVKGIVQAASRPR